MWRRNGEKEVLNKAKKIEVNQFPHKKKNIILYPKLHQSGWETLGRGVNWTKKEEMYNWEDNGL